MDESSSPCMSPLRDGMSWAALCQYWPHWGTEVTLGTCFLRSELGEGSGRKEMQADRRAGLRPGSSAGYMWSMGPRQHSLGSYHDFFGNGTEKEPIWLGRLIWHAACSLLWPVSAMDRLSYFYGSGLLPTPELNALTLRSKWWILPLFHYLAYSFHMLLGVWLLDQTWQHPWKIFREKVISSFGFQAKSPLLAWAGSSL